MYCNLIIPKKEKKNRVKIKRKRIEKKKVMKTMSEMGFVEDIVEFQRRIEYGFVVYL